jgi:ATP phosphoribosyltransferase
MSVTLALPSKGAIADPTIAFLSDCGLRIDKPNPRQYTGSIPAIPGLELLFQRATDVLYKVADGTAQLGITGLDIVREFSTDEVVVIHEALKYGHCQLVVAVPEAWVDVETMTDVAEVALDLRERSRRNLRIATKYPLLSRRFLYQHHLHHFTLVAAEGAIEAAPTIGYADVIIDLTQTGTTLRENHLKPLPDGVIVDSQACLIGNRSWLKHSAEGRETLRLLLERMDAALTGRDYSHVTVNMRGGSADEIAARVAANPLTHGLQGPTIAPIYGTGDPGWYTVTIIIANRSLLNAVDHLRAIGAAQAIVTPVRYVFHQQSPTFARLLAALEA